MKQLKAGDVRQENDLVRIKGTVGVSSWWYTRPVGTVITQHELQSYEYMRPDAKWLTLHRNKIRGRSS